MKSLRAALRAPLLGSVLATLALVGPSAMDVVAQRGEAELTGEVVSAVTGEPIAGAFIGLEGWEIGTYSRREGNFRLPSMPAGPRRYVIEALGYLPVNTTLDASAPGHVIALEPDEELQHGLEFLFAHLENRRNAGRTFDREAIAFSGAYDVREFLAGRGVRRVRRYCVDERADPGIGLAPPQYFYLIEVHGSTVRLYSEDFLEETARQDEETIQRIVRRYHPLC